MGSDSLMILPYQAKAQQQAGASETHSEKLNTHSDPEKNLAVYDMALESRASCRLKCLIRSPTTL
eukprot:scaffold452_cov163-Skeletonema_marinoi.AAC.1